MIPLHLARLRHRGARLPRQPSPTIARRARPPHGVLLLDLARRDAGRPVQRAARAGDLHGDRGVSARARRRLPARSASPAAAPHPRSWRRDAAWVAVVAAAAVASVAGQQPVRIVVALPDPRRGDSGARRRSGSSDVRCASRRASRRCSSQARWCRAPSAVRSTPSARSSASTASASTSQLALSIHVPRPDAARHAEHAARAARRVAELLPSAGPDRPGVRGGAARRRSARTVGGRRPRRRIAGELRRAGAAVDVLRDRSGCRADRARPGATSPTCRTAVRDVRSRLATRAFRCGRVAAQQFGLIMLDAFSSDAIPIHLLTREALSLYLSRLAPGGVIALHISNLHLSLSPVLGAPRAESEGLAARWQREPATAGSFTDGKFPSEWMVLARDRADFGPLTPIRAGKRRSCRQGRRCGPTTSRTSSACCAAIRSVKPATRNRRSVRVTQRPRRFQARSVSANPD